MTGRWPFGLLAVVASLAAFVTGAAYAAYLVGPPLGAGPVRRIAVEAVPVPLDRSDPGRNNVGRLRYLGGLALASADLRFGGLSDLLFEPGCGRLLGVTDAGSWVILDPEEAGDRLTGIRAAFLAPLLDASGAPPDRKRFADAEALMRDPRSGDTLVWFELDHRAQRYRKVSACRPESLAAAAHAVDRPEAIRRWRSNAAVEAAAPDGSAILLLAEREPAGAGHMAAVRLSGARVERGRYPAPDELLATAAAELEPGVHLVLQRRMPRMGGFAATLSLLRFVPGNAAERTELVRFGAPLTLDNFEGLALRREGGRTFLYLVSDDNFLPVQRTLLLKFELLPG